MSFFYESLKLDLVWLFVLLIKSVFAREVFNNTIFKNMQSREIVRFMRNNDSKTFPGEDLDCAATFITAVDKVSR